MDICIKAIKLRFLTFNNYHVTYILTPKNYTLKSQALDFPLYEFHHS